ncbi:carbohydrate binding domain-containing protein [Citrobacter sp. Marseille-Q6884]|uniref:carbohydrate binding domain-containing protein n=1 Tax=Citrobacter sp. Marseille-Q6884 TaxID=2956786 RepID=UPI0021B2895D|nr:carbohydrate binding domain-containing protein [Citrobacter sp. Marseille-Q6884]
MISNIINDGDFNPEQLNAWSFSDSAAGVQNESETVENYYAHINATESAWQGISIPVGQEAVLSFKSRGQNSGTVSVMMLNTNTIYWSQTFNTGMNVDWTTETMTFTVQESWTGPLMLHFQATYNAEPTDAVDIDDVRLLIGM